MSGFLWWCRISSVHTIYRKLAEMNRIGSCESRRTGTGAKRLYTIPGNESTRHADPASQNETNRVGGQTLPDQFQKTKKRLEQDPPNKNNNTPLGSFIEMGLSGSEINPDSSLKKGQSKSPTSCWPEAEMRRLWPLMGQAEPKDGTKVGVLKGFETSI